MQLLTTPEAISYLRTSKSALDRAVQEGRIKKIKPLHKPLFIKEELDRLIKGSKVNNA